MNDQESFWRGDFGSSYIERNDGFDTELGARAWRAMLAKADRVDSILELGSNVGRNTAVLSTIAPDAALSICEINEQAFNIVTSRHRIVEAQNCGIRQAVFAPSSQDLVFTMGVLIHVHPEDLIVTMSCMYEWSRRYVLIGEYFNKTPVTLEYREEKDKLFKCDFGRIFADNFDVKVVDYGFLWTYEYDDAGFDDINWWLFEKIAT